MMKSSNILSRKFPDLCKEWDYEKNYPLIPSDVTFGCHNVVWWVCKNGHKWKCQINSRTNMGSGCPYCSGRSVCKDNCLAFLNPKLSKEWHPNKNNNLTPEDVTCNSSRKVWWKCKKKHEWMSEISSRNANHGCPYCSGHKKSSKNSLTIMYPDLMKEWDFVKNGKLNPDDFSYGSRLSVWWKCKKGHEWSAAIKTRSSLQSGCPMCRGYVLRNGEHFDSLLDVWFYFKLKRERKEFIYNKRYPKIKGKKLGKKGLCRFDFYLPKENKYIEVTSYSLKFCVDKKQYNEYLKKIKLKKYYVENVLKSKFEFFHKRLTKEEKDFVKKYIV